MTVLYLILSNLVTAGIAVWEQWSLSDVLWIYWGQSIIIGFFNLKRIFKLQHFSTRGFRVNHREVTPTPGVRLYVAIFFALHYGFFHFIYFVFLAAREAMVESSFNLLATLGCIAVFAFNHRYSYRQHLESDLARSPNIRMVMMFPYARILPMHLMIVIGIIMSDQSAAAMLLFTGMKTIADVIMHLLEHRGGTIPRENEAPCLAGQAAEPQKKDF